MTEIHLNSIDSVDFVQSVMAARPATPASPAVSSQERKRHRSESAPGGSDITLNKKMRDNVDSEYSSSHDNIHRVMVHASEDPDSKNEARADPISSDPDPETQSVADTNSDMREVLCLFKAMSSDMRTMFGSVNDRISQMEMNLEGRLSRTVEDIMDKKLKETIQTEMNKVRDEFQTEIKTLNAKIDEMEATQSRTETTAREVEQNCNIVITYLKEDSKEKDQPTITRNKVVSLLRDGLKLKDVYVTSATRKVSRGKYPGVVVATLQSAEQKSSVMKAKSKLKDCNIFRNIYIENDIPLDVRKSDSNMRILLRELGKDKYLTLKGGRIVKINKNTTHSKR